ncbi:reticulon-like protein B6 isoform X2 [Vicia villosa]|uniref:reticulon-like protein B6 isoform X2 n=1 Tax=Vicia villosa TaxID=3911 RepID=UPI00273CC088|nr:reticulon-like protein B6 isoform X2 [Vicia villosa]
MVHHVEFMDVADSDFLGHNRELDDDDSEFETVFEKYFVFSAAKNRFFARKLPLHFVLGSGIVADIILWRKKRITASILAGVTVIWIIFKRMEYTLISFICDSLVILLAMLFLWTHLTSFIDITPPKLSALILPEGLLVNTAISMTKILNKQLITFGFLASGRDFKKFLMVTWTLGVVSLLGTWFAASTIFYIGQLATYRQL